MLPELVGRDREMSVMLACLEAAQRGQGNLVVCVGEPGIGKTRLAEELTRAAKTQGVATVWGRAAATAGAPPYWPWHEALEALAGAGTSEALGVAQPASGTADEPSVEQRMRYFDAVSQLVQRAARRRPLLLVLDDLDRADEPSRLLARHVARSTREDRLCLAVTCRDTAGALATLAPEPGTTQVQLRGLDRAAVAGRDPSADELRTLYDVTAGNPFFVSELARQLADEPGQPASVPRSVRDAIGLRLGQLSPGCAATLRAAAVLGSEFEVDVLAAVTQRPVLEALQILDEAARSSLLVPGGTAATRRFAHELVRDAIVANLDAGQSVALHHRAAEALEHRHAAHPGPVLFDLAQHWAEAAVAGDGGRAVSWIERAGREAMRQHAYEDGRHWFTTALTIDSGVDDVGRCRRLLALAAAQTLSSDLPGALTTCGQVLEVAVRLGRADLAGEAALVPEPTFDPHLDHVIRGLCEQAMPLLRNPAAALRARVLAQYAVVCDHLSDLEAAYPAVDEALALAGSSDDAAALEAALTAFHMVRSGPDGLAERESNADRMWELGTRSGRAACSLTAAEWRFDAASERGDLSRAARELEVIARWADRVGGPLSRWRLLRCRAMLAQARGQLSDAYRNGAQALGSVAATGFPPGFMLWSGFLATLCHHTGQSAESLAANGVTDADATGQDWPLEGLVLTLGPATQLAEAGRLREASVLYRRLGPASEWQESPHAVLFTWMMGIATATAVDADEDVATLRAKLAAYRGHHIVNGRYAMAYCGPAELWLGIGAAHLGLLDEAVTDLEHAVKVCAANGAEGFRAEAQYELASALVRRSAPDDLARARSLLAEALTRMDHIGMPAIRSKADDLLSRIDGGRSGPLTRREREVATLVAQGLTNRQIAQRLYLSERTAQNHVQHILDKLDLPNRSQIAVWVREQQMSTPAE